MKLAALALVTTLGLGGIVHAEPAGPGPGPGYAAPAGPGARSTDHRRGELRRGELRRGELRRGELRQLLLERFDRNHDGQLDAQERHRAIRALRRLARRMAVQDRRGDVRERREARLRELVRRYDRNDDGVVSPDEMPPGVARRLQRLDRNRDGWLDGRDER